jgi:multicomponent Na+:H+ antiporter subunit G
MIEIFASSAVAESSNNPGWFLVHAIGIGMGVLGLIFFLGTAVGMIRFPDFYTRMHAAGKGDTLSTMLMLTGFGLVIMEDFSIGSWLLLIKILGIVLFIFITTPTSSHALMRAAFEDDEMPLGEKDLKKIRRRSGKRSVK